MDTSIVERMKEVQDAVIELDESIRPSAFAMMSDYILTGKNATPEKVVAGGSLQPTGNGESPSEKSSDGDDQSDFIAFADREESDKPAENAKAIAAYLYGQYGLHPFSIEEIQALASSAGLTIPTRVDKTFAVAKSEKKPLFKKTPSGHFRPTVHGEAYFKKQYSVKKGTRMHPDPQS